MLGTLTRHKRQRWLHPKVVEANRALKTSDLLSQERVLWQARLGWSPGGRALDDAPAHTRAPNQLSYTWAPKQISFFAYLLASSGNE